MSSVRAQSIAATPQLPPDVLALDSSDVALQIAVLWGEHSVLHVDHLSPPRAFWIGEEAEHEGEQSDFLIGRECLGVDRMPIVLHKAGHVWVVVPHGARCLLEGSGRRMSLEQLVLDDRLAPCAELADAVQFVLPRGARARVEHNDFVFLLELTPAALPVGRAPALQPALESNSWTLASVGAHLAMLLLFYMMPPRSEALSYDTDGGQARRVPFELLPPSAQEVEIPQWVEPGGGSGETTEAQPAAQSEARPQPHRPKVTAQATSHDDGRPAPPVRGNLTEFAENAGIIALLKQNVGTFQAATTAYDQSHAASGTPDGALAGVMNGMDGAIGGGLDMIGFGRGANDYGGTVASGDLRTIGGPGGGPGGYGPGNTVGFRKRTGGPVPTLRAGGKVDVRGSLSKEVISRVIHRHTAEVRFCYEQQLIAHPDLQGRVAVKFIIGVDGSVTTAAHAGGGMHNAVAEQCVVQAVKRWTFPSPDGGGIVIVTYPFVFAQAGN